MKTCYMIPLTLWLAAGLQAAAQGTNTIGVLAARVGALGQNAALLRQWAQTADSRLAAPPNPASADLAGALEASREALARQRAEIERLERELEELKAVRKTALDAESDLEIKIQQWQDRLALAQMELQRLLVSEAELMRQLEEANNRGKGFIPGRKAGDFKQLDVIVVNGNLVAPTDPPWRDPALASAIRKAATRA